MAIYIMYGWRIKITIIPRLIAATQTVKNAKVMTGADFFFAPYALEICGQ